MKLKALFFILFTFISTSTYCKEYQNSMTQAQGNILLNQINHGLNVLKQWSDKNTKELNELKLSINEQKSTNDKNSRFNSTKSWDKVKSLSREYLLLLEASYAFARHSQSQSELSSDEQRAMAWSSCLSDGKCNFKKINTLLLKNDLKISDFIKQNAKNTQLTLIDSIEKLNELSLEAENSEGLNSSIDALTKVSATQANVLVSLNTQLSDLAKLKAQIIANEKERLQMTDLADKRSMKAKENVHSSHMSVMLGDIK